MKLTRIIAGAAASVMLAAMLTACGGDSADTPKETEAAAAAETTAPAEPVVHAPPTSAAAPTEPVDISAGVTDAMYERALLNEGGLERLAAAMRKAQKGEPVTVGVIGGSITQGSLASNQSLCYGSLFFQWWQEKFPDCQINTVNAGIGGTNSYLGVNRVDEQLLSYDPDVVIVEFSVNDTDKVMNKYSYDSLVRKILSNETNPAVMLLFTTQEDGTSLQETHKEIGTAYDLPMLSYREIVYPEVKAGTLDWKEISPDNIHPNDVGHGFIGQMLSRYLDEVYDKLDTISEEVAAFDAKAYTSDYYKNAKMYFPSTLQVTMEGFAAGSNKVYPDKFPENWVAEAGGTMSFETECQTLGIFYLKTTDGKGGEYEVYVDGERKATINSDFTGGWGNYGETKPVFIDMETAKHSVEIKPAAGSEDKAMTILGVMLS